MALLEFVLTRGARLGLAAGLAFSVPAAVAADDGPSAKHPPKSSKPGAAGPSGKAGLAHALSQLASDDPAAIQAGLTALGAIGSPRMVQPILDRIHDGLPPALTLQAIAVLSHANQRRVAPRLVELLAHRRPEIRRATVEALAMLGGAAVHKPLVAALDDPAPQVQQAAVTSLMVLGDARAVPPLLAAHDRGVKGAIEAVGELARRVHVTTLATRAKGAELDGLVPALDRILQRPKLPVPVKLRLLKAVVQSESPTAGMHLARWLQSTASAPLAKALRQAVADLEARQARAQTAPARPAQAAPDAPVTSTTNAPSQTVAAARRAR